MAGKRDDVSVEIDRGQEPWRMSEDEVAAFAQTIMTQPVMAKRKENAGVRPDEALTIMMQGASRDSSATRGLEDVFPRR